MLIFNQPKVEIENEIIAYLVDYKDNSGGSYGESFFLENRNELISLPI